MKPAPRDRTLRAKLRIAVAALNQIAREEYFECERNAIYPTARSLADHAQRDIARVGAKKGRGK